jgi:hypothetical protein
METDRKAWREMEAIKARTRAMRENIGTSHKEMVAKTKPERDMVSLACRETTETHLEEEEPTSVDMKPEVPEQREVPVEDAEVMPVGEPKKKMGRDRNQRRMKKRNQEKDRCRRRGLAVTRRGTSHRAKVARKTNRPDGVPPCSSGTTQERCLQEGNYSGIGHRQLSTPSPQAAL